MTARLYGFAGSNACISTRLLLDHAGIDYEQVVLKPGLHALSLRARRFPGQTVPAMEFDGRKIVGSRAIASAVAASHPEAGLLPPSLGQREAVLHAEQLGERLQNAVRRVLYVSAQTNPAPVRLLVDATYGGWPRPARAAVTRVIVPLASYGHGAKAERINGYLDHIARVLDELDELVARGVLGDPDHPNVADFQVAPNVTALTEMGSGIGESVAARPIGKAALRILPAYPLQFDIDVPAAWAERLLR